MKHVPGTGLLHDLHRSDPGAKFHTFFSHDRSSEDKPPTSSHKLRARATLRDSIAASLSDAIVFKAPYRQFKAIILTGRGRSRTLQENPRTWYEVVKINEDRQQLGFAGWRFFQAGPQVTQSSGFKTVAVPNHRVERPADAVINGVMLALALHSTHSFACRNKSRHVGNCSESPVHRRGRPVRRSIACDSSTFALLDSIHDDSSASLYLNSASMYHSLPSTPAPPQPSLSKRPFRPPGTYIASSSTVYDPMQAKTAYHDGPLSRVLLTVLCWALGMQMRGEGQTVRLPWLCDYEDFVRVAKMILQQGRTPEQQEQLIRRALNNSIPGGSGT